MELLDSEYNIHGNLFNNKLVIKADVSKNPKGINSFDIEFLKDNLYFFEKETEKRIFLE